MRSALLLAAVLAAAPLGAAAQDAAARNLAAACAICHGTAGHVPTGAPVIPLAGLPKDHIATQMKLFRDGKRPATVMHQIAKGYTDQQIEQMAAYFAAQGAAGAPPRPAAPRTGY